MKPYLFSKTTFFLVYLKATKRYWGMPQIVENMRDIKINTSYRKQ